jgi:hypothetical protein
MNILSPLRLPYDPAEWAQKPFTERARMVCEAWALQGYGSPLGVYGFYVLKVGLYIAGWAFFCSITPGFGGMFDRASAWLSPVAFQKAIVWSMLFEGLGLGCGSGPLTGHYLPPIGGVLYFARPGTTKLAMFPRLPVLGGVRRTLLDVGLYVLALAARARDHARAGVADRADGRAARRV